jgi:hypothetical protein
MSVASVAHDRQQRLIRVADAARAQALKAWQGVDFTNLDASWASISPSIIRTVVAAQSSMAIGSDRYTTNMAAAQDFDSSRSAIVPQAFSGVDGQGRDIEGVLRGAVTTTKQAVGAGLGSVRSLEAGASYLAVIMKTLVADLSRSADLTSAAGKSFTHYIRMCNGSACSRCAILAGMSSGAEAFRRHVSCQCCAVPVASTRGAAKLGLHTTPREVFDAMSDAEQDKAFTRAGAQAIRDGADITKVVNARRGANGIGYSSAVGGSRRAEDVRGVFTKTTIGYRPDGTPVKVYTTAESTARLGSFGRTQLGMGTYGRVRLMPESIMEIAGNDLELRQAFLRDAGYLDYIPPGGFGNGRQWAAEVSARRRADRVLVDRATLRFNNFTLS